MKIKLFVAREIQYFELGIFSFNSYVYYLTRGFIASTRAFNLATRAFSLLTRGFELVTREFELVTRGFELVTREFELVTREFELVTRGFELVTRVLLFNLVEMFNSHYINIVEKTSSVPQENHVIDRNTQEIIEGIIKKCEKHPSILRIKNNFVCSITFDFP